MSLPSPTLHTARLSLRPFDDADADDLFALQSNAYVLRYWDSPPWSERARSERFITACRKMAEEGTGARLAVDRLSDGVFLGWCSLNSWNPDLRSASLGYCFNEAAWGHGYATEAARALLGWAFDTLDLNRVQAEADTRNLGSARVLEKLGFVREGTLREDCIVNGDVSDSWVYGLLRREWREEAVVNRFAWAIPGRLPCGMTSHLFALSFDAHDPGRLARFWAGVLDRKLAGDGVTVLPSSDLGFPIRFLLTQAEKTGPNQMHFDLTSASPEDMQQTVARALELGGRHLDIGQGPEIPHVVLADPEGNEFCVIEPDNNFLADTDVIGALSSDGSQQVGYFWSEALSWPLVWDQDEETAIQSPLGGSKISWGGPPVNPKTGKNRLVLELAADGDQQAEVDRLVSLGATRVEGELDEDGRVPMLDADGNEFWVLAPR